MRRKLFTRILSVAASAAMLVTSVPSELPAASIKREGNENLLKLWYDEPASKGVNILGAGAYGTTAEDNNWQQHTLPIGNSYMGANVYGEIAEERLTFNQKTLWNGGPSGKRPDYNGGNIFQAGGKAMSDVYQEVVDAFLYEDSNASAMCNQLVGKSDGYGAYQSWGDIYLTYGGLSGTTPTTDYERNLDLATATANVDFTADGVAYHREYFISHPDNVLVMKLTSTGGTMDVNVSFPVDNGENVTGRGLGKEVTYTPDAAAGTLVTAGRMQDNQLKMNSVLKAETKDGSIAVGNDSESLDINGATEIIFYVSADTDYKNEYPEYRTKETDEELAASVANVVAKASQKGFGAVKESHLKDYQKLFDRVTLDLGQAASDKTTDMLLAAYKNNSASDSEKRLLEVILYQYGRYMTIASSRAGDLPSNLQGVWQNRVGDHNRVPWGSDYHMNVNLQMNYWPTYSANLAECAIPLIDYVNSLREPGRVTAEAYFGIKSEPGEANGFSAHTQNTPFGWTCPGWSFSWGWSPAAVPWIIQNCWEHYEYTGDVEYMKENLYPMMREEAILYDQILVDSGQEIILEDGTKSTRLVSAPAYSPEHGPRTLGNVYENELIWQLYEDTITAAEVLGVDEDLVANWKANQARLAPIEIGDDGQIKEWFNETSFATIPGIQNPGIERAHRHMSHLLALYPGDQISVENKEYIDAAVVSLTDRTDNATGWGIGQRINAWARTGDGDHAHKVIISLFKNGIYPNLWDSHAPFQIDGNFGYTAGVNEMLMQSNAGYINILPAIPDVWPSGSVDGIVTRGNFVLGMDWAEGKATKVTLLSKNGGECIVQAAGIKADAVTVKDSAGNTISVTPDKDATKDRVSFETKKGETYTITGFGEEIQEEERLDAPANVRVALEGDARVLTWDAVAGADSYVVYRKVNTDFVKINETDVTGTTYTDSGEINREEGARYRIAAVKDGKEGKQSAIAVVNFPVEEVDVTITFRSDKTVEGALPAEATKKSGASYTLPDCTATVFGYVFAGWTDGRRTYAAGSSYTVPKKSVALTAVWEPEAYTKLDKSGWSATAESEKNSGNDGPASSAIDNNESTWWHSNYPNFPTIADPGANNCYTIDFGETVDAVQFEYVPRTEGNGFITGYRLYYSETEDGEFTEIGDGGKWAHDSTRKSVMFENAISMRRIMIRATETDGGTNQYISAVEFNVYSAKDDIVLPQSVTADTPMTLKVGESKKINASVQPADATYQELTYKSSNTQVAKVSADGTVTGGTRPGTAEITISAVGNAKSVCTVTVTPSAEVKRITLEKDFVTMLKGGQITLIATVEPYYGVDKTVIWKSDNEAVATVDNGTVQAISNGKATITATASNNMKATCEVWVADAADLDGNSTELNSKYEEYTEKYKDLSLYTSASAAVYQEALEYAEKILGMKNPLQSVIDNALTQLNNAAAGLVQKAKPEQLEAFKSQIEKAKGKNLDTYTKESADIFKKALEDLAKLLTQPDVTDQMIQEALRALEAAEQKLVPLPPKGQDPISEVVTEFEDANIRYKVTKSDAANSTVTVVGLTASGSKKSKITIPSTVAKGQSIFKVTAINKKAFYNNKKLKNVVIGLNVTSIGANSFQKCKNLKSIQFLNKKAPKTVGKNAFKGIKATCKISYPKKMKAAEVKKLKKKMKSAGKKVKFSKSKK